MKKSKKSRAKKTAVKIHTAPLEYVSYHVVNRCYQHILDIVSACRQVEAQLRQQGQNPLADTLKFLNLAEPRLTEKIIECAIRPFFYFGTCYNKIPNQKPFQDAVSEKLSNPEAQVVFEQLIHRYFQVFDSRIDGRNGKRTIRVALDRNGTPRQSIPTAVHSIFPWIPTNANAAFYIGQLVTWNDCKFFIAYGRLTPKVLTAFKRSVSTHRDITHGEFLGEIQSQLFTRLADPYDKHRLDQYLKKNTPSRADVLLQLSGHVLNKGNSAWLGLLVEHAARQTTAHDLKTFCQKLDDTYNTIVLGEHKLFPSIAQSIPRSTLPNSLFCNQTTAVQHLQALEQHPLRYLHLTPQTLLSANLSSTHNIHQARAAELPQPLKDTIERAWKTYATEQRLIKIIGDVPTNPYFYESSILSLVFQLADARFLHTKVIDIPLESRFQNYLLSDVGYYLYDYPGSVRYHEVTLHQLINPPENYDPMNFNVLPKVTKTRFTEAILEHLSTWRQTTLPTAIHQPTPAPTQTPAPIPITPAAQTALDALDEINDLFDTP